MPVAQEPDRSYDSVSEVRRPLCEQDFNDSYLSARGHAIEWRHSRRCRDVTASLREDCASCTRDAPIRPVREAAAENRAGNQRWVDAHAADSDSSCNWELSMPRMDSAPC